MSYAIYKQMASPTGAEHCCEAHLEDGCTHLVIAAASTLYVYEVARIDSALDVCIGENEKNSNDNNDTKRTLLVNSFEKAEATPQLRRIAAYDLSGKIMSLNAIPSSALQDRQSDTDVLLLTFKGAKVSVVEFDPSSRELDTIEIHDFGPRLIRNDPRGENGVFVDNRGERNFHGFSSLCIAKVDPGNRCAVMLCCGDQLVVMPFASTMSSLDGSGASNSKVLNEMTPFTSTPSSGKVKEKLIQRPYIISLWDIGLPGTVSDVTLLDGYYEPALCILQHTVSSWGGSLYKRQFTGVVTVLSLNMLQRLQPKLWFLDELPYDAEQILPVPAPNGGLLVISSNALQYLNQHHRITLALNGFAPATVNQQRFPLSSNPPQFGTPCLTLDAARCCFLEATTLLISIQTGELYILRLDAEDGVVKKMEIQRAGTSVLASCVCVIQSKKMKSGLHMPSYLPNSKVATRVINALYETSENLLSKKEEIATSILYHMQNKRRENSKLAGRQRGFLREIDFCGGKKNVRADIGTTGNVTIFGSEEISNLFEDSIYPACDAALIAALERRRSGGLVFLGSRLADSLLLECTPRVNSQADGKSATAELSGGKASSENDKNLNDKNLNEKNNNGNDSNDSDDDDLYGDDDMDLYGDDDNDAGGSDDVDDDSNSKLKGSSLLTKLPKSFSLDSLNAEIDFYINEEQTRGVFGKTGSYAFRILDRITGIGPIGDATFGLSFLSGYSAQNILENKTSKKEGALPDGTFSPAGCELTLCTGLGKTGAMTFVKQGLNSDVVSEFSIGNCQRVWGLRGGLFFKESEKHKEKVKIEKEGDEEEEEEDHDYDDLLVLRQGKKLRVLHMTEEGLSEMNIEGNEEVEPNGVYLSGDDVTLEVSNIAVNNEESENEFVVQIHTGGIRLIRNGKIEQIVHLHNEKDKNLDLNVPKECDIIHAAVLGSYVLLQIGNKSEQRETETDDNSLLNCNVTRLLVLNRVGKKKEARLELSSINIVHSLERLTNAIEEGKSLLYSSKNKNLGEEKKKNENEMDVDIDNIDHTEMLTSEKILQLSSNVQCCCLFECDRDMWRIPSAQQASLFGRISMKVKEKASSHFGNRKMDQQRSLSLDEGEKEDAMLYGDTGFGDEDGNDNSDDDLYGENEEEEDVEGEEIDYSKMTVKELKEEMKRLGIEIPKGRKKVLIEILEKTKKEKKDIQCEGKKSKKLSKSNLKRKIEKESEAKLLEIFPYQTKHYGRTIYSAIVLDGGELHIYDVATSNLVFRCLKLHRGRSMRFDDRRGLLDSKAALELSLKGEKTISELSKTALKNRDDFLHKNKKKMSNITDIAITMISDHHTPVEEGQIDNESKFEQLAVVVGLETEDTIIYSLGCGKDFTRTGSAESVIKENFPLKFEMLEKRVSEKVKSFQKAASYLPASDVPALLLRRISHSTVTRPPTATGGGGSHSAAQMMKKLQRKQKGGKYDSGRFSVFSRISVHFGGDPNDTGGAGSGEHVLSGIFCGGVRPCWILSIRGQVVVMPMNLSHREKLSLFNGMRPVLSFCSFSSGFNPGGFVYYHRSGSLRFCQFSSPDVEDSSYAEKAIQNSRYADNEPGAEPRGYLRGRISFLNGGYGGVLVARKVNTKCTPRKLCYLGDAAINSNLEMGMIGEDDDRNTDFLPTYAVLFQTEKIRDVRKELEAERRDADQIAEGFEQRQKDMYIIDNYCEADSKFGGAPPLFAKSYDIRLMCGGMDSSGPGSWCEISRIELKPLEVGCCMEMVSLPLSETDHSQHKSVVAVGTMMIRPKCEDEEATGRIIFYEVKHVRIGSDENESATKPILSNFYEKEFRGGVGAITQMKLRKYIALTTGSKLFLFKWMKGALVGLAFFDGSVYVHTISAIRDFIVLSDVHDSIQLLRWKENDRRVVLLAKDYDPLDGTATDFLVNDRQLGIVAADTEGNLQVFQYAPLNVASRGGNRLLPAADFHLGSRIVQLKRRKMLPSRIGRRTIRYTTMFGTLDGGIGALVPLDEGVFRRLHNLQRAMVMGLQQNAGLNPWCFRTWKPPQGSGCLLRNPKRRIVDGNVIWRYIDLDVSTQQQLARCIGSTPEMILDNLLRIDLGLAVL
eukprot:g3151.t1